ncbi:hypothetical protein [Mycobacteroides abscessus]|uniref:hypothetical protein n=1 Tax=Mycobacteroides abscessus TaxID=36809 RepID=UPI002107B45F|nr:hypothetical protein [Mycobacteroides abscessus]
MTVNLPVNAKTRGIDQVEALAVRHSALVAAVDAGAVWTVVAAANRYCVGADEQPKMLEAAYKLDSCSSQLRHLRIVLAVSFNDTFQAAALLQPELSCNHAPTLVPPLRTGVGDLRGSASAGRYNGTHVEGMGLLPVVRQRVQGWESEVADAEHFLSAAGIQLSGFSMYSTAMREAIDESLSALETAYMAAIESIHLPMLRKGRKAALLAWLHLLKDAGISPERRAEVVTDLEAQFPDIVNLVRRVQDEHGESWP